MGFQHWTKASASINKYKTWLVSTLVRFAFIKLGLNKVKNLLWRAWRNAIPTKGNLVCRMVLEDPVYDWCNGALENPLHALWSCSELDMVWTDLVLWSFRHTHMFVDFKELLSWVIQQDKNLKLFAMTAWSIWTQQNRVRLAQPNVNLHLLEQVSKDWQEEFIAF